MISTNEHAGLGLYMTIANDGYMLNIGLGMKRGLLRQLECWFVRISVTKLSMARPVVCQRIGQHTAISLQRSPSYWWDE